MKAFVMKEIGHVGALEKEVPQPRSGRCRRAGDQS